MMSRSYVNILDIAAGPFLALLLTNAEGKEAAECFLKYKVFQVNQLSSHVILFSTS